MNDLRTDLETIATIGGYENADAVVAEAVRELLRQRPELRVSVAVEKYQLDEVSLNRAAELAGVSAEQFKDELAERGIGRNGDTVGAEAQPLQGCLLPISTNGGVDNLKLENGTLFT
jgi:predicted HTH domain antitoxin